MLASSASSAPEDRSAQPEEILDPMAHFQQLEFISRTKTLFPEYFSGKLILEVGSWDTNGTVRGFFVDCDYVGADVASGPGVDLVCQGQEISYASNYFDVTISCECFEHNPYWLGTFFNMLRMLKPGGLCLVTCATTGRGEHGTQRLSRQDSLSADTVFPHYYRNLCKRDFTDSVDLKRYFSDWLFLENIYSFDLYFVGLKTQPSPESAAANRLARLNGVVEEITRPSERTVVDVSRTHLEWHTKRAIVRLLGERHYHDLKYRIRKVCGQP